MIPLIGIKRTEKPQGQQTLPLQALQQRVMALQSHSNPLRKQLQSRSQLIERMLSKYEQFTQYNDHVQRAVALLRAETKTLESQVRSMAQSNRQLKKQQDSLTVQNSRLKQQLKPVKGIENETSPFHLFK